jgi:hypothetical protein
VTAVPKKVQGPITGASIVAALVPATADAWLDHGIEDGGLSDLVVGKRPPRTHLLREDAPRDRLRCVNAPDFPDAVWIEAIVQVCSVTIVVSP